MIIVMKKFAENTQIERVLETVNKLDLKPVPLYGTERTVIAVIGDERPVDQHHISSLPGVDKVMSILDPFKLASRDTKHEDTIVDLGDGVTVGGKKIAMMAGPCAVESETQMESIASEMKKAGVQIMRGGAYKPRTSPYSFEGLGSDGLELLSSVAKRHGLKTITEIVDIRDIDIVGKHTDIFQIGTRNMQNFNLLKEVGKTQKPVLLKRGMSATIKEFLLAAEHIMMNGNSKVMLCERGIRTFETETRNTLALATVPLIKELSHLPIIVDPSHSTGKPTLVSPMTKAAIAAGADGILVDVHPNPQEALCDGDQAIKPETFHKLMEELKPLTEAVGRLL
ncbi:3-deoxy-7-phosphoheptulonate synthase [Candidatus Peregrinibacteria bacterium]|nr:3-deoxy-7-phosphoheptulonate synthase [Candidatus Peregrinibacteria bacterium]